MSQDSLSKPSRTPIQKPLCIGSLQLPGRFMLAPLAGISDWPFRILALRNKASLAFTEMVSSEGLIRGGKDSLSLLERHPEERIFAPQIFGANPKSMAQAARIVEQIGADLVDINMGCPVKKVCRTGAGAALMQKPDLIREIVESVVEAVSIPVSVKLRIGWDASSINIVEIARIVKDAGALAICVHGRTRAQGYSGVADWDTIATVKSSVENIIVIGNGDIFSAEDALRKVLAYGVDGAMIGRGSFGNPWLFEEIDALASGRPLPAAPSYEEWRETIDCHLDNLVAYRNGDEIRAIRQLRKHLVWYTRGMRGAQTFRSTLASVKKVSDVRKSLDRLRDHQRNVETEEIGAPTTK